MKNVKKIFNVLSLLLIAIPCFSQLNYSYYQKTQFVMPQKESTRPNDSDRIYFLQSRISESLVHYDYSRKKCSKYFPENENASAQYLYLSKVKSAIDICYFQKTGQKIDLNSQLSSRYENAGSQYSEMISTIRKFDNTEINPRSSADTKWCKESGQVLVIPSMLVDALKYPEKGWCEKLFK
jgi:hypothetical protein